MDGYASECALAAEAADGLVDATATIMVELAARFAADALNEAYFGWDEARFSSRGAHNLLRARGQLALAKRLAEQRTEAQAIVTRAFTRGSTVR